MKGSSDVNEEAWGLLQTASHFCLPSKLSLATSPHFPLASSSPQVVPKRSTMRPSIIATLALAVVELSTTPAFAQSTATRSVPPSEYASLPTALSLILPSNSTYTDSLPQLHFGLHDWDAGPVGPCEAGAHLPRWYGCTSEGFLLGWV